MAVDYGMGRVRWAKRIPPALFRGLFGCGGGGFFRLFEQFDVGDVERALAFNDGTVRMVLRFALVLFDYAHAFDDDLFFFREDLEDFAGGSPVVAGDYLDHVAALNVKFFHAKKGRVG
jgi:hypothetical protein